MIPQSIAPKRIMHAIEWRLHRMARNGELRGRLNKLNQIQSNPSLFMKRKRIAREFRMRYQNSVILEQLVEVGYARTSIYDLGMDESLLQALIDMVPEEDEVFPGLAKNAALGIKDFRLDCVTPHSIRSFDSPVMRLALNQQILELVAAYLGVAPGINGVHLFYTPPHMAAHSQAPGRKISQTFKRSQLWHFDYDDARQVKVFIYPKPVFTDSGPTSLISRTDSAKIQNARYIGRFSDEAIEQYGLSDKVVACTGDAGTIYLIDTSACCHMGNRSVGERLVHLNHYTTGFSYAEKKTIFSEFKSYAEELSPLQNAALGFFR